MPMRVQGMVGGGGNCGVFVHLGAAGFLGIPAVKAVPLACGGGQGRVFAAIGCRSAFHADRAAVGIQGYRIIFACPVGIQCGGWICADGGVLVHLDAAGFPCIPAVKFVACAGGRGQCAVGAAAGHHLACRADLAAVGVKPHGFGRGAAFFREGKGGFQLVVVGLQQRIGLTVAHKNGVLAGHAFLCGAVQVVKGKLHRAAAGAGTFCAAVKPADPAACVGVIGRIGSFVGGTVGVVGPFHHIPAFAVGVALQLDIVRECNLIAGVRRNLYGHRKGQQKIVGVFEVFPLFQVYGRGSAVVGDLDCTAFIAAPILVRILGVEGADVIAAVGTTVCGRGKLQRKAETLACRRSAHHRNAAQYAQAQRSTQNPFPPRQGIEPPLPCAAQGLDSGAVSRIMAV